MSARRQSGFTLVEVLIALAITAFVSMIAYTSISSVMISVSALRESSQRTFEINRAWMIMSRDIQAFAPRPVRDEFGEMEPALSGGSAARYALSLSRTGWHNPLGHPRSNVQRVNYRVEEEALWRDTYFVLDRASDTEAESVLLLEDVEYMEFGFLRSLEQLEFEARSSNIVSGNWDENWVNTSYDQTDSLQPPLAIEVRLQLKDWGEMRRIYALPPL